MPSIFSHRVPSPSENNYQKYRPYIREDFHECCAYCLLHERFANGERNFELDHFKPKSKYDQLKEVYTNIYYSCHVCNRGKWHHWPSEELQSKGYRFIDTCRETFSEHFVDEDGYWKPISNAGKYTAERIRLNSPHNIEIRKMVKSLHNQLSDSVLDWDKPIKDQLIPLIDALLEK
ncbi:MAG: hypothetical protein GWP15_03480 [Nitrospirae bacterium]|nr:hypothetical protein [Nitrospirota bacterium]